MKGSNMTHLYRLIICRQTQEKGYTYPNGVHPKSHCLKKDDYSKKERIRVCKSFVYRSYIYNIFFSDSFQVGEY